MQTQTALIIPGTAFGGGRLNSLDALTVNPSQPQSYGNPVSYSMSTTANAVGSTGAVNPSSSGGKSVNWLVGLIVVLILAKLLAEKQEKDGKIEMHHIRISVLNWAIVTALAIAGIGTAKVAANKYSPNSSFTKVINAA